MSATDFVVLKGGLTLPLAALQLAWELETRGLHFTVDGDELLVGPRDLLTDADRCRIRRWKLHLLAIASYDADAQEAVQ
jgi:hypothetical protein